MRIRPKYRASRYTHHGKLEHSNALLDVDVSPETVQRAMLHLNDNMHNAVRLLAHRTGDLRIEMTLGAKHH